MGGGGEMTAVEREKEWRESGWHSSRNILVILGSRGGQHEGLSRCNFLCAVDRFCLLVGAQNGEMNPKTDAVSPLLCAPELYYKLRRPIPQRAQLPKHAHHSPLRFMLLTGRYSAPFVRVHVTSPL